jgi:hypothetical protein
MSALATADDVYKVSLQQLLPTWVFKSNMKRGFLKKSELAIQLDEHA